QLIDDKISTSIKYLERLSEYNKDRLEIVNQLKVLASKVKQEKYLNRFLVELEESHKKLYLNLVNYKRQEECKSISNIEDSALKFYTEINKHDHELEKIHSINFKEDNGNYRILLRLSDGRELDAFCILSEGHLRSLGLSLLLAICEKQNHPTIIFDDVVNAIDSDHRKNIIELFIADPYLSKTQRIITTHDRLFWERICNYCSQDSE
nr:recombination protein RecF [Vibrio anguillarum]